MDSLKTKGQMYDQIDLGKIQKSGFDLSNNVKGTGRIGRIIPTRCQEVLPGDRMKGSSTAVVQFEPLAVPMLANMYVRQEHFYVPNRIVWKNWDKFFTGGEKLDFATPPPSFTLSAVWTALQTYLPTFLRFLLYANNAKLTENDGWYAISVDDSSSATSMYGAYRMLVSDKADMLPNGVADLCQPYFDVVEKYISDLVVKYPTQNNKVPMLGYPTGFYADSTILEQAKYSTRFAYAVSQSPDPYEAVLAPYLDSYVSGLSGDKTNLFPMLDEMRNLVHMLYDSYRQFIGVSSNLDYLSYKRLTPTDMYYLVYMTLIPKFANVTFVSISFPAISGSLFSNQPLTAFALRANYIIWYNYYRDQLLELDAPEPSVEDSVTTSELFQLLLPRQRCWSKDTFTTALANTGTGNVVVPVVTNGAGNTIEQFMYYENGGADANSVDFIGADVCTIQTSNGDKIEIPTRFISGLSKSKETESSPSMFYFSLDMLDACRRAQKWLQKALIYGNRPQDRLYTSWGVRSLDARLSLPECLATSSQIVQLSVNTNNTTITDANGTQMSLAGDKSANAYGYDDGGNFNRFCEEHGLIISFLTILPEATYPYSVKRGHSRLDKFDYPTPEFATLGMDAVYESELCPCSIAGFDEGVFGYQGRYFDAKCNQDEEHGELQTSQNMYTFGRQWSPYDSDTRPKLNYQFVHCFPKLDMFVVDDSNADYFRYDIHHALAAERALPVCGMYL